MMEMENDRPGFLAQFREDPVALLGPLLLVMVPAVLLMAMALAQRLGG